MGYFNSQTKADSVIKSAIALSRGSDAVVNRTVINICFLKRSLVILYLKQLKMQPRFMKFCQSIILPTLILVSGCGLIPTENLNNSACPTPPGIELPQPTPQCPVPAVVERIVTKIVPLDLPPMATTAGKMHLPIIGAVEWAKIGPSGLMLEARIDTGAETTSIHAKDIQLIEKDGRRYVRFVLIDTDKGDELQQELRLRRRVLIKHNEGPYDRRYVVRMWVTLGKTRSRIDVNLSDRSDFKYPMLIGRNFLTDSMIVDVSRHHTLFVE
mgnify:FL=1